MGFITAFHALSKEGTGVLTDLTSFCYRPLFFCFMSFKPSLSHANEHGGTSGGAVHMHDSEKARN
jgi:hypothetical protein